MIRSGDMDRLATLQSPADSTNSIGEPVLTWSTFATRWIALLPLSGNESINAMANQGVVTHRIRMRYTSGLKPKMRVVAEGRTFEIMSAVERGRREEHELLVSEVVD
jgi:SPP1 family predicted phage head-tail adaptor